MYSRGPIGLEPGPIAPGAVDQERPAHAQSAILWRRHLAALAGTVLLTVPLAFASGWIKLAALGIAVFGGSIVVAVAGIVVGLRARRHSRATGRMVTVLGVASAIAAVVMLGAGAVFYIYVKVGVARLMITMFIAIGLADVAASLLCLRTRRAQSAGERRVGPRVSLHVGNLADVHVASPASGHSPASVPIDA